MAQAIQPSDDPKYKQSRAALRQIYGTRRIDASDKQSPQDQTPSGRAARFRQEGMTNNQANQADTELWRRQFQQKFGQMHPEDFANNVRTIPLNKPLGMLPDPSIAQPQPLAPVNEPGFATADDILNAYKSGATSGQFNLPNGGLGAFGPLPASTPPAASMASFLPTVIRPQRGYMSSVLDSASRWTR